MNGPDGVRDAVANLLRWDLPRRIVLLRKARGLDQRILPDIGPDRIISGERPDGILTTASRSWIEVINPRKLRGWSVGLAPSGNMIYRNRWALRIYGWALASEWDDAIASRDNLMSAMTACLLEYPTLNTTEEGGDTGFLVNTTSITEEPGIPQRIQQQKKWVWCPGALYYQMDDESTLDEGSTRPPLGTADEIVLSNDVVGPATPFPGQENQP